MGNPSGVKQRSLHQCLTQQSHGIGAIHRSTALNQSDCPMRQRFPHKPTANPLPCPACRCAAITQGCRRPSAISRSRCTPSTRSTSRRWSCNWLALTCRSSTSNPLASQTCRHASVLEFCGASVTRYGANASLSNKLIVSVLFTLFTCPSLKGSFTDPVSARKVLSAGFAARSASMPGQYDRLTPTHRFCGAPP